MVCWCCVNCNVAKNELGTCIVAQTMRWQVRIKTHVNISGMGIVCGSEADPIEREKNCLWEKEIGGCKKRKKKEAEAPVLVPPAKHTKHMHMWLTCLTLSHLIVNTVTAVYSCGQALGFIAVIPSPTCFWTVTMSPARTPLDFRVCFFKSVPMPASACQLCNYIL